MDTVLIIGNTYPVKDKIKALGGRWNAMEKGWDVPVAKADEARSLVSGAPKSSFKRSSRRHSGKYRSCWDKSLYGEGGYYDRLEGMAD